MSLTTRDKTHRLHDELALSRVGEHLPGQVGGTFDSLLDYVKVFTCRFGLWQLHLDQIGVAHDPGEDIVEVVGDSTGQNSQAFEFLGVEQSAFHVQFLLLGPFAVGDVDVYPKDTVRLHPTPNGA